MYQCVSSGVASLAACMSAPVGAHAVLACGSGTEPMQRPAVQGSRACAAGAKKPMGRWLYVWDCIVQVCEGTIILISASGFWACLPGAVACLHMSFALSQVPALHRCRARNLHQGCTVLLKRTTTHDATGACACMTGDMHSHSQRRPSLRTQAPAPSQTPVAYDRSDIVHTVLD